MAAIAVFDLQVITLMLPTKFKVNKPSDSTEEAKIDFQDGCNGTGQEIRGVSE